MDDLLPIRELSRRSQVPVATIKYYVRAGLIAPAHKTGRTMSWYEPKLVERLRAIKELQRRQFLPLDVIKQALDKDAEAPDDLAAAEAIAGVLAKRGGRRARTRQQVLAGGASPAELDWLARAGLAVPGADGAYRGDDLALLSTLGAARKAGIRADMLPFDILHAYLEALRALVDVELRMFRRGVLGRAKPAEVASLAAAATRLSERLVVVIRRKLLVPTLERVMAEERGATGRARPTPRRSRRSPSSRSAPAPSSDR